MDTIGGNKCRQADSLDREGEVDNRNKQGDGVEKIDQLINRLKQKIDDPRQGLPEEVFLFVTSVTPMVNVDLLVRDGEGRVLLAWRNDPWYGSGWHVPGSIVRVKESFEERIRKCAEAELHSSITFDDMPLEMFQIVENDFQTRCHFFSFVFDCKVPDDFRINNGSLKENETGYLKWHNAYPEKMLRCHEVYRKYFNK